MVGAREAGVCGMGDWCACGDCASVCAPAMVGAEDKEGMRIQRSLTMLGCSDFV